MTPADRIEIHIDQAGEYRWTAKTHNNKIVADSAEGYVHEQDCENMARSLFPGVKVILLPK